MCQALSKYLFFKAYPKKRLKFVPVKSLSLYLRPMEFKKINLLGGWISFAIALIVYLLTLEPTVSLWDCGEFIASSYKLQVGHPPGAPLWLMIGRLFSLFTSDTEKVAMMINATSAFASAFTIMFLFWTISHLLKKLMIPGNGGDEKPSRAHLMVVLGGSFVGGLSSARWIALGFIPARTETL